MSVEAIQWALSLPHKNPTHKVVLIALANHADPDGGQCHPSIERLETYTGLHRASIIRAIQQMEELGIIGADHERGKRTRYELNLAIKVVAERDQSHSATSRTERPHQSQRATTSSRTVRPKPSLTINNRPFKEEGARGTRLAPDWKLPAEWWSWAADQGLAGDEIDAIAETFRDWWHSAPGSKGVKADWQATWRNWCRRELKDQRRRGPPKTSGRSALMDEILRVANEPAY